MAERDRTDDSLTKSDLIEILARDQAHLAHKDVELAVKSILEKMSAELAGGERIEIRGFGSFSLHFRGARMGRNPKSGDAVALRGKHVPHFKPGKELRERVNASLEAHVPLTGDGSDEVPDDADDLDELGDERPDGSSDEHPDERAGEHPDEHAGERPDERTGKRAGEFGSKGGLARSSGLDAIGRLKAGEPAGRESRIARTGGRGALD